MANLTQAQLAGVAHQVHREFSAILKSIPIKKDQFFTFLNIVDNAQEQAEIGIIQNVPVGQARTWLMDNPEVARRIIELIAVSRKENL